MNALLDVKKKLFDTKGVLSKHVIPVNLWISESTLHADTNRLAKNKLNITKCSFETVENSYSYIYTRYFQAQNFLTFKKF